MKYIKSYILFVLMVFAVTGCKMDDLQDDVNDLKDRVTLIEQQVKLLNSNLAVISYILDPQNKTISKVEAVVENGKTTQHVITLSDGSKLTLTIGKPGTVDEPVITIGEDGKWYINGVSTSIAAVGEDGKNGEGYPEFRVEKGNWQVRFGTGDWENVPGGENIVGGGASLGDQFFESATVSADGKSFVVTLKDGTIHTLPVVQTLSCAIDKSGLDSEGFLVLEKGERKSVLVKIDGGNPQVTYPQGWRATLNKLDNADANGNNYQLFIYAPAAQPKAMSRAAADNSSDVTVQVQKGMFWAVDKIKVKTPKEFNTNLEKYDDGQIIKVGGLNVDLGTYKDATEITESSYTITKGGVYFVSTNNVTLKYDVGTEGVDNLIILPNTPEVTTINFTIPKQIYLTGTFICQNVILNNTISNFPLRVSGTTAKILFDTCKINGLLPGGKGLVMANVANTDKLGYFEMTRSDVRIDQAGAQLYLIHEMDCPQVIFEDNIVYYSGIVPEDSQASDNHLVYFKLFNGTSRTIATELKINSNTFIDVESTGSSGITGFAYCKEVKKLTANNNLFWLTYPATEFAPDRVSKVTVLLRTAVALTDGTATGNYAYSGNSTMSVKMLFSGKLDTVTEIESAEMFDKTNSTTFNKTTGVFVPKSDYAKYGAQRKN